MVIIHRDLLELDTTISAIRKTLRQQLSRDWKPNKEMMLQYDNLKPYTSQATEELIVKLDIIHHIVQT